MSKDEIFSRLQSNVTFLRSFKTAEFEDMSAMMMFLVPVISWKKMRSGIYDASGCLPIDIERTTLCSYDFTCQFLKESIRQGLTSVEILRLLIFL